MPHQTEPPQSITGALRHTAVGIRALRTALVLQGQGLVSRYIRQRDEASTGGFIPLNLRVAVRENDRSVQIEWVLIHVRKKIFRGTTLLAKPKDTRNFDLATLKRSIAKTEWLWPIAIEAELEARPLRESLARLTEMERGIRAIANRLCPDDLASIFTFDDNALTQPDSDEDLP